MPKRPRLSLVRDEVLTPLETDARTFAAWLDTRDKASSTIDNYLSSIDLFRRYLVAQGRPPDTTQVTRQDVEGFMRHLRDQGRKSSTRHLRYASLSAFFRWAASEVPPLIERNPMMGMQAPRIVEEPLPILTDQQVKDVVKVCEGTDFKARRDNALIRMLLDTGARRAEVAGMKVADVNLRSNIVQIKRKGGFYDHVTFGQRTRYALDRYLRMREQQKLAHLPNLWITSWSALTPDAVGTLLREIGTRAGIPRLTAHAFRHRFAHEWMADGRSDGDLMRLMGWHDRSMLDRYARGTQKERAHANRHKMKMLADRV